MLRINRQTDYAVRVILALAARQAEVRTPSSAIQEEMLIPQSFLPRIVAQLAHFGLILTFTGREGGLQLARPASEITLKDVVEAFEGPLCISDCLQAKGSDNCPFQGDCRVQTKWDRVQRAMLREMASINFADLSAETQSSPLVSIIPISIA